MGRGKSVKSAAGKRYTEARIRRALACNALGLTARESNAFLHGAGYIKPLAVKREKADAVLAALAEAEYPLSITGDDAGRLDGANAELYRRTAFADGVFSEKMVGDGFAVEPEADEVLAPADGEITLVFDTKHAFTMRTAQGVDLLVHMGIDTIRLNGEPFTLNIQQGDTVKAGQSIGTMDRAAILAAGYRTVTPVVVGNLADLGGFELTRTGEVKAGDAVMEVF